MHLSALGFAGASYLKLESTELFLMFLASRVLYNIYTYINICMNDICHTFHSITNLGFVLSRALVILPLLCYTLISSHINYTCSLPLLLDMHSPLNQHLHLTPCHHS